MRATPPTFFTSSVAPSPRSASTWVTRRSYGKRREWMSAVCSKREARLAWSAARADGFHRGLAAAALRAGGQERERGRDAGHGEGWREKYASVTGRAAGVPAERDEIGERAQSHCGAALLPQSGGRANDVRVRDAPNQQGRSPTWSYLAKP